MPVSYMYTMELPSQSGLISPSIDPGTDSDSDHGQIRTHTRKSNKPLLEKKRRARINKSLDQLKSLVLEALKKDSARYSKLEKADILEMTVKHLREVQRHQMSVAMSVDPTVVGKFQSGFGECAQEVDRYLSTIDGLSAEVRLRLMQHLSRCSNQAQTMASYPGLPPMYHGVPSGSPPHALPGVTLRCALPFGGLALSSPESPSLPVSQASMYSPGACRITGDTFTPKATPRMSMTPKSEPFHDFPGKLDNTENIAPMRSQRPLTEKRNSSNLLNAIGNDLSERNNNDGHAYMPPPKRQKMDAKYWHGNVANAEFKLAARNFLAMDIKLEPVWRPW